MDVKIEGFDKLSRKFNAMPDKIRRNALKRAVRAAAKPVIQAIKAGTPVGPTGRLKKSIGKKEKSYFRSGTFVVIVGPRIKKGKFRGQHGLLVELGTKPRETTRKVSRGTMPANPFIAPVWNATARRSRRIIVDKLWEAVRLEARKNLGLC